MKEGPLLMPCQKRFGFSWEGICIQMQKAPLSVLCLICAPIWDWGKRELIATNSWNVLISIAWIIFLSKRKIGLIKWTWQVFSFSAGGGEEKGVKEKVKEERKCKCETKRQREEKEAGPHGTWSNNLTACQHTSGADIPPASPPSPSLHTEWSYQNKKTHLISEQSVFITTNTDQEADWPSRWM